MKSISKLKDEARRHELKEEWERAIQAYLQALHEGESGEAEVELPLYNRVGDLFVRLGRDQEAVQYYEQAADRYSDAGLYNNAIALCNKALRYDANNLDLLRKLGVFSALQGFHTDARRYFVEYADRQIALGKVDDALNALEHFARIADDADSRELLGRRMQETGRAREAVVELRKAYDLHLAAGEVDQAEAVRADILSLDPTARFETKGAPAGFAQEPGAALQEPVTSAQEVPPPASRADAPAHATSQDDDWLIEPTTFEPPDAAFDVDDAAMQPADIDEPIGFTSLEGLETTALDLAAAAAEIEAQDLGPDIVPDRIDFDDERAEATVEPFGSAVLPDIDLGLPPHGDAVAPPAGFELEGPAAHEGGFESFGDPLPSLELPSFPDEAPGALELPSFNDAQLPSFDLTTFGEDASLDVTVPEPPTEDVDDDLDAASFDLPLLGEDEPAFDLPPVETGERAAPPAATSSFSGWPEDPEDDYAPPSAIEDFATIPEDEPLLPGDEDWPREISIEHPDDSALDAAAAVEQLAHLDELARLERQRPDDARPADDALAADETVDSEPEPFPDVAEPPPPLDFAGSSYPAEIEEVPAAQSERAAGEEATTPDAEPPRFAADEEAGPAWVSVHRLPEADDELPGEVFPEPAVPEAQQPPATAPDSDFAWMPPLLQPVEAEAPSEPDSLPQSVDEAPAEALAAPLEPPVDEARAEAPAAPSEPPIDEAPAEAPAPPSEPPVDEAPAEVPAAPSGAAAEAEHPDSAAEAAAVPADLPPAGFSAPASREDYVDLASLFDDERAEETTRFRITETVPTGDEDQDFAELLNRFRQKVAEHVPSEDAAAHYDLGLAFKEMGLIDEAISEFQVALRSGHMQLKVYEELGQCFIQKEQYNIAEKVLRQALNVDRENELDLLGIYYQLGRACEALGRTEQARDAYERVLGMDLSFHDTAERLARL